MRASYSRYIVVDQLPYFKDCFTTFSSQWERSREGQTLCEIIPDLDGVCMGWILVGIIIMVVKIEILLKMRKENINRKSEDCNMDHKILQILLSPKIHM